MLLPWLSGRASQTRTAADGMKRINHFPDPSKGYALVTFDIHLSASRAARVFISYSRIPLIRAFGRVCSLTVSINSWCVTSRRRAGSRSPHLGVSPSCGTGNRRFVLPATSQTRSWARAERLRYMDRRRASRQRTLAGLNARWQQWLTASFPWPVLLKRVLTNERANPVPGQPAV